MALIPLLLTIQIINSEKSKKISNFEEINAFFESFLIN